MVGKYSALDDRIVEMIGYMRKNGVKRLIMQDDAIEVEFQERSDSDDMAVWVRGGHNDTSPDETSYYSEVKTTLDNAFEKDKN